MKEIFGVAFFLMAMMIMCGMIYVDKQSAMIIKQQKEIVQEREINGNVIRMLQECRGQLTGFDKFKDADEYF